VVGNLLAFVGYYAFLCRVTSALDMFAIYATILPLVCGTLTMLFAYFNSAV
ncbi:hypothetical protein SK128_025295, partial [Halocaridina rubra]